MIKVETNCSSKMTDEEMRRVQGMGIEYLAANFVGEDACYDGIVRFQERAARYGLKISNAGCPQLQKCPSIHLGKRTGMSGLKSTTSSPGHSARQAFLSTTSHGSLTVSSAPKSVRAKYNHGQNLSSVTWMRSRPVPSPTTVNTARMRSGATSSIFLTRPCLCARKRT